MRGMRAAGAAILMGLAMIGLAAAPPGRAADLEGPQPDQAAPTITRAVGPGLVTGPDAQAAFEALRRGGLVAFTDFEDVPTGLHKRLDVRGPGGDFRIGLRTTLMRWPWPPRHPKGAPVAMLPYDFVTEPANHRLMGVTSYDLSKGKSRYVPDGQSRFELTIDPPASHVGLLRPWSTYSVTNLYGTDGTLLESHRNTANHEFVGYIAATPEDRVRRIEFDGIAEQPDDEYNRLFQVGQVDDLYLGSPTREAIAAAALPAPAAALPASTSADTTGPQSPDRQQEVTNGDISYDALEGLGRDADDPTADAATEGGVSKGDGATEADPGAAPRAPAATEERPGVPPAGNASSEGSAAKAPHPLFELMAMLILSEAQRGETTEDQQAIATGAARDLITFLQHLGVLKAGASGDLTENDLLQAIEALRLPSQERPSDSQTDPEEEE